MKHPIKGILALLLVLLMSIGMTACGSSGYKSDAAAPTESVTWDNGAGQAVDMETTENMKGEALGLQNTAEALGPRKIIYTYSAELQTLQFDETLAQIEGAAEKVGGYIEESSRSGSGAIDYGWVRARTASYTLRIPADAAGDFVQSLSAWAAVTQSSRYSDDVTDYYYDSEARLNNLRVQETRLLELLAQAESVGDMITIEQALSEVRYEIECMDGTLRRLDNQIEYSRVELQIEEVFEPEQLEQTPRSLGDRITARFRGSISTIRSTLSDFIVFLLGDSLLILFWGVVLVLICLVGKKLYKKSGIKLGKKHQNIESDKK